MTDQYTFDSSCFNECCIFPSVQKLNTAIEEYDLGRRYLANIMGLDDENMSQEDVRVSKRFLLTVVDTYHFRQRAFS